MTPRYGLSSEGSGAMCCVAGLELHDSWSPCECTMPCSSFTCARRRVICARRPSLAMLQEFLGCAEMMVHRLACLRETKHASRPPLSHEKRRTPCTSSTKADT